MFGPNYANIPELRDLSRQEQRRWWRSGYWYAMNRWWFALPYWMTLFLYIGAFQFFVFPPLSFNKWQTAIMTGICMIPYMLVFQMLTTRIARPYWREVQAGRRFLGNYTTVRSISVQS